MQAGSERIWPTKGKDRKHTSPQQGLLKMQVRLNKFLAQAGVSSRREADKMIAEGRVRVNGQIVQTLGQKIDDVKDQVEVNGKRIKIERALLYILLNKPLGYLVTRKDPFQRPTVMDLIPLSKRHIFPVGRLDIDSEGLLLLTNDGELANRLLHPRYEIKKIYEVSVKGVLDPSCLSRLEKGIYLDGKKTAPAKVSQLSPGPRKSLLRIEIYEGRKREVRRMMEAFGLKVLGLKRVKFAGLTLTTLKPGEWRNLRRLEVDRLKELVGLKK